MLNKKKFIAACTRSLLALALTSSNLFAETKEASEAGDAQAEIAKQLSNPVANLISIPFQNNWDQGYGPKDANRYTLNIEPVIPFSISDDWNVITRTIVPIVHQGSPIDGVDSETGLGDITQSFFFSPKKPTEDGWIWGTGPALLYTMGNENLINSGKWGLGPTAVLLKQKDGWTYGGLMNHIWSYAGTSEMPDVNSTFLQPFLAYTTKTYTTFTINTESTYDWESRDWTIPLLFQVSQLVKIGKLPVSFAVAPRYYAENPETGEEWAIRFTAQLIFPE